MMKNSDIRPTTAFVRLALWSGATVAAALAVGYLPTHKLAGAAGVAGMLWGLGIALLSALTGLVPAVLALRAGPQQRLKGALAGAAIRFVVMLALLLGCLLSGPSSPPRRVALAIWAAIGYILLLAVDTVGVVWQAKRAARASS